MSGFPASVRIREVGPRDGLQAEVPVDVAGRARLVDALSRLESMVAMSNMNLPERTVRQQIASAITIVVQCSRLSDGSRRVMSIAEITGMDENVISMQDIFTFERKGIGPNGKVIGTFKPSGIRPKFLDRLRTAGVVLPAELFDKCMDVQ